MKLYPSRSGAPLASGLSSGEFAPSATGSLEPCPECGRPGVSAVVCAALDRIGRKIFRGGKFIERSQPKEN